LPVCPLVRSLGRHGGGQGRLGLYRLEQGNVSRVEGVGGGVFEYKIHFGPGYRIYFGKDGERLVILLGGGSKKRQGDDIAAAQACWRDYKRRETSAGDSMALTREFRATLLERARHDAEFRQAMLKEGIDAMLAGEMAAGKAILRDYINAAVGFGSLAEATNIPAKSLMRMLGPKGNPRAENLFQIIHHLQTREGIHLGVGPC